MDPIHLRTPACPRRDARDVAVVLEHHDICHETPLVAPEGGEDVIHTKASSRHGGCVQVAGAAGKGMAGRRAYSGLALVVLRPGVVRYSGRSSLRCTPARSAHSAPGLCAHGFTSLRCPTAPAELRSGAPRTTPVDDPCLRHAPTKERYLSLHLRSAPTARTYGFLHMLAGPPLLMHTPLRHFITLRASKAAASVRV